MAWDTPGPDRPARDRGREARHANESTLASYLSSALYLFSVPVFILVAHAGHWLGWYAYGSVLPVFAGLLVGAIGIAFAVMSRTGR